MNNFNFTVLPFDALVAERQISIDSTALFITISPNPHTNIECIMKSIKTGKNRTQKRPYGMLPQKIQYQYCLKCLAEDYLEWFSSETKLVGIAELNNLGNVHLHIIVNDPKINNVVKLQMLRRDVLNGVRTQQNIIKGKVNAKDWMNNIVFVTESKEDIIDYFMKDQSMMLNDFNNFYM